MRELPHVTDALAIRDPWPCTEGIYSDPVLRPKLVERITLTRVVDRTSW
jgi:hypothetical protein